MHVSLENRQQHEQSNHLSFGIKPAALVVFVIVVLVGMLVDHPAAVKSISDAVQAEFAGAAASYDLANGPVWP
jgi:hypothetical protein